MPMLFPKLALSSLNLYKYKRNRDSMPVSECLLQFL